MHFRLRQFWHPIQRHIALIKAGVDAELRIALEEIRSITPDNPALNGFHVFSQNDEDGIIQEIFRRLGGGKTFLEIGCGNGLQNNTHYLLLGGWTGTWLDGSKKNIDLIRRSIPDNPEKLRVIQRFVDRDNVDDLPMDVDFLSLDIDGNDIYVLERLLRRGKPKVICVEYNADFPPPMKIAIQYDPAHTWDLDIYQGASLQAFTDLLVDYRLVACNVTGTNAFFVRNDLTEPFTKYEIGKLYRGPKRNLFYTGMEQRPSFKFLANLLRQ